MKRASFFGALIYVGISILLWQIPGAVLPVLAVGAGLGISAGILYFRKKTRVLRDLFFYGLCVFFSAVLLLFPIGRYYETVQTFDGKTHTVTAILTEDPVKTENGIYRYTARPKDGDPFSEKFIFFCSAYLNGAGGGVTAEFTFERPTEEFFYGNLSDGVALTAKLETYWESVVCSDPEMSFTYLSNGVRRYVHNVFLRYLGAEDGGFMTAVLTGDKSSLSSEQYAALENTGMLHIVAVSGLHVSIFVAFVLFFLRKIPSFPLRNLCSVLALLLILFFSGFTPSVCRAVVMSAVLFLGNGFLIGSDPFNRLGIAAIVILLFSPYAALSLSFQLSFAASLGIIVAANPFRDGIVHYLFERRHLICGDVLLSGISLLSVSLASFLFTLPLMWFSLRSFSVWSLVLSLPILPVLQICFVAALILLILSLIPFAGFLCGVLGTTIRFGVIFMTYLASSVSSLMGLAESLPPLALWLIAGGIAVAAVILFLIPGSQKKSRKNRAKVLRTVLSLVLAAVALLTAYQAADQAGQNVAEGEVAPAKDVLQTAFLDVGQGNCFVSVLNQQAYVVDCGGTEDPGHVAADYLTSAGIDIVEFVLISHLHSDHANGLADLCEEKEVKEIIIPYTEGDAALYARITALAAEEGAVLTELDSDAERKLGASTLYMFTEHLDPTSEDQNENSIVGLSVYGDFRALFTGDITDDAEKRLVAAYGERLQCDVLSVPHHGSKSSSSKGFLETAAPVYSVISVGAKNTYGHPTQAAMDRITAVGSAILRTDISGTVTVRTDGEKMEVDSSNES